MIFGHDFSFWIAVVGATLIKAVASESKNLRASVVMVGSALLTAWVGTEAVLDFFSWNPETYKIPTAVILALVGENLMRFLIRVTPETIFDMWGGKK